MSWPHHYTIQSTGQPLVLQRGVLVLTFQGNLRLSGVALCGAAFMHALNVFRGCSLGALQCDAAASKSDVSACA